MEGKRDIPLKETDAYPAQPQDAYGWEKMIAERFCLHYREDYGVETHILEFYQFKQLMGAATQWFP